MSAAFAHALDVASEALTFLFLTEVVLKLLGLGTWGFASDAFNVFDLVVVATGVLELALTVGEAACSGNRHCRKQYATLQHAYTSTQRFPCRLLCPLQMGANGNALRSFRTLRILRSFHVLRVLKVGRRLRGAGPGLVSLGRNWSIRCCVWQLDKVEPNLTCRPCISLVSCMQIFRYLDSLRIIAEVLMSSISQFLAVALLMVGVAACRALASACTVPWPLKCT